MTDAIAINGRPAVKRISYATHYLDPRYRYVGAYTFAPYDRDCEQHLRLVYDLRNHRYEAEDGSPDVRPAAFVNELSESWSYLTGPTIFAAASIADFGQKLVAVSGGFLKMSHEVTPDGPPRQGAPEAPAAPVLAITCDEPLDESYRYIGVYSQPSSSAGDSVDLRILYDLGAHGAAGSATHYAAFAAKINDYWSDFGGYYILGMQTLPDVRERYLARDIAAIPQQRSLPDLRRERAVDRDLGIG